MKKTLVKFMSVAALSVLGGSALAQQPTVHPAPMPATVVMPAGQHWEQPCNDNCNRGGLYFEAGVLLVKPRWDNNEAYNFSRQTQSPDGLFLNNSSDSTNFDFDLDWMPRIVAGYGFSNGFGARVRWAQGSWDDNLFASVPGGPLAGPVDRITSANPLGLLGLSTSRFVDINGDFAAANVYAEGELRVLVWDFEATRDAKIAGFDVTIAGGMRYLHISQDYRVAMDSPTADGLFAQGMVSGHNINGFGPTFAIDARTPVLGGLGAYGSFRQSVIFANGKQTAIQVDAFELIDGTIATPFQQVYQERDTVIPVTELEVGGEYSTQLGNTEVFGRIGFVGQVYFAAGNTSRSGNSANELNSNLGLVGVSFSGGIRY